MLTVQAAKRLEVWSNLQCAAGARQGFLLDVISCVASVKTNGDDKLTLSLPLASAGAALLIEDAIVRVWQDDATWDEWVVTTAARDTGAGTLAVECDPVAMLLGRRGLLVGQTDTIGVTRYDVAVAGLTPTQILDTFIVPTLTAAGLTWLSRGTVDPIGPIDLTLSWDSPLAILTRMLDLASCELQLRRNGTAGYFIDLVTKIGAGAATADIRVRKNLLSLKQQRSVTDYNTRVFPRGSANDANELASMGRAVWNVASIAGGVVGLADPVGGAGPILYDGQLVGAKIRKVDGSLTAAITASSAGAQTVTVPSAAGIAVGDLVQIRKSDGTELTYLETTDAGKSVGLLDNPDIPATNNLIPNPGCRAWPGTLPTGWTAIGGPATAKQIVGPFTRIGGASIHVTASGAGQGVQSPTAKVFPSALEPYGSGHGILWVVSGQVRVDLVVTKADTTVVTLPVAPNVASSTTLGQWENLGVSGEDLNALTAVSVAVRITSIGVAEFYVDAVQVTESASQLDFVEGSGGTRLWQAANDRLRTNGGPSLVYDVPFVDLSRLDGTTYSAEQITLGANARVTDDRIPVAITTRIIAVERDHLIPGNSKVTLSTLADDLMGTLARPVRPPRIDPVFTGTGTGASDPTAPIAAPALTLTSEVEDVNGLPAPVLLVAFTPPVVAGFAGLMVSVRGLLTNSYATQAPVTDSPIRVPAHFGITYDVQAWAVNKAGVKSSAPSTASFAIPANHRISRGIQFLDPSTHTDDGFVLKSTTNDGKSADSGVKESGGKIINRLLAKGLPADVDTLDGVPEGSTFKRVNATATGTSGFIDFTNSGFVGKNVDNVQDGNAWTRTPQGSDGANLAENGNFEASSTLSVQRAGDPAGPPGWRPGASVSFLGYETVTPYSGNRSLKLTTTVVSAGVAGNKFLRCRAGDRFRVTGQVKSDGSAVATIQLMFLDINKAYISGIQPGSNSTNWTFLDQVGAAPAGTVWCQISLQTNTNPGTAYFDDIFIARNVEAAAEVIRGGGNSTSLGTIIGNVTDVGHLGSAMQESGGKAVNRLLAKALAADADSLDGVVEGTTFKRVHNTAIDGSGFVDFSKSGFSNKDTDHVGDGVATIRTTQYAGGDNLAENANFEGSSSNIPVPGWVASGAAISLDTVSPFAGSKSLKVIAPAQFGSAVSVRRYKVRPGEVYRVSCAAKNNSATDQVTAQIMFLDSSGTYLGGAQVASIIGQTPGTWIVPANFAVSATAPAGTAYGQISLQNNGATGGTVWFDDLVVLRVRDALGAEVIRGSGDTTALGTIVQNVQNSGHLGSAMQESGGKSVNRLLAKSVSSDPDSLDGTPDGTTFKRVTGVNGSSQITPSSSTTRNACRASFASATPAVTSTNTVTKTVINWDAEAYDTNGLHSTSSNLNRITIPSGGNTGVWYIHAHVQMVWFAGDANAGMYRVAIRDSSGNELCVVRQLHFSDDNLNASAGETNQFDLMILVNAPSVGEWYEVVIQQNTGVTHNIDGPKSYFEAIHLW